ncbi:unnamed protein product [Orchesella dallaii]|uniref:Uncharacterized protein n=1 Tax=Orchesella dallaii TaxID=48710 RepID=A0ABP1Q3P9_9HEXA
MDYLSDVELRLALRKILETGDATALTRRQKRGVLPFLMPALQLATKALASKQLNDFFKGIFTGDNGILSTLAMFRAASPEDRKAFTDLSNKVSEFETETKKLFIDVLKKTDSNEQIITTLQENNYELSNNMVTFKELLLLDQSLIADTIRLLYVSNVYAMHFEAFSDCRSGKISPTFIPLTLLAEKLRDLESRMPANKNLVIPSVEAYRYYKLNLAECVYDSRGGLVKIAIPLRKKQSAYKLFEYKPLQFAYLEYTCSMETPTTLVIKDGNSNDVFPITELDIEFCDLSTGLCRLPMSTDMDTWSICIAILLKGSPAELIKENCKFQCTKRAIPDISKITDDVYIGTHLPQNAIEIRCPGGEILRLSKAVSIGSTRLSLACTRCKLFWNNRLVASSSDLLCKEERRPAIETLLPIQFSDLKDLRPDGEFGIEKTVFSNADEIVNLNYDPETGTDHPPEFSIMPYLFTSGAIIWDIMQSLAILYILYRSGYLVPVAGLVFNNMIIGVNASKYTCNLPTDVYAILWAILILNVSMFLPSMGWKAFKFLRDLYNDSIETAAARQERERLQGRVIPLGN